jgi:hypothetical protein
LGLYAEGDQSVGDLAGPGIELAECRRAILEYMGDAVRPRLGLVADNVSTGLQDVRSNIGSGWSMSALPPKADIRQRIEHVCFVPLTDILAMKTNAAEGLP